MGLALYSLCYPLRGPQGAHKITLKKQQRARVKFYPSSTLVQGVPLNSFRIFIKLASFLCGFLIYKVFIKLVCFLWCRNRSGLKTEYEITHLYPRYVHSQVLILRIISKLKATCIYCTVHCVQPVSVWQTNVLYMNSCPNCRSTVCRRY